MIDANTFPGLTDSEVLDNAFSNIGPDGIVVIPPRCRETGPERNYWLIDRAIRSPENPTVSLRNRRSGFPISISGARGGVFWKGQTIPVLPAMAASSWPVPAPMIRKTWRP